jgi:hypothetical protein
MPSHQTLHGTTIRSTTTRVARMAPTITQFDSSSARLIRRASAVMRKTTTSRPMAYHRVCCTSDASATRPLTSANSPCPAEAAQPPAMKAKITTNTESGIHNALPGGTRPHPTTGASPVARTYRVHSTL